MVFRPYGLSGLEGDVARGLHDCYRNRLPVLVRARTIALVTAVIFRMMHFADFGEELVEFEAWRLPFCSGVLRGR